MKAIIGLMKITTGDNIDKVCDFLSKLSGAVVSAATGSGYTDLINVGIEALSFAYNEAKKKYDEDWITKVLVVDREPADISELIYIIKQIYEEDKDLNVIQKRINWHIVHAGLNAIFKAF